MHAIRRLALGVVTAVAAVTGCSSRTGGGGKETTPTESALAETLDMIRAVTNTSGRPPTKVADFAKLEHTYPLGYKMVKSGEVVVVWGVGVAGEGNAAGAKELVIAYEKNAPTQGGYVLMTNGTVKKLSADEFASAPKAK